MDKTSVGTILPWKKRPPKLPGGLFVLRSSLVSSRFTVPSSPSVPSSQFSVLS